LGGGNIVTGKNVIAQEIGCMFHKKDARFSIRYYESERLLVVYCISCTPRNELIRAKIARDDA